MLQHASDQCRRGGTIAELGGKGDGGIGPCFIQRLRQLLDLVTRIAVMQHDIGTRRMQRAGNLGADPARGAGNQNDRT